MASTLPPTPAIAYPFANLASARNTIPPLSQTVSGGATLQQGFPPECSLPISGGGIPPSRLDMNGMAYIATFPQYFLEQGGFYTYDPNVASAIGGYPLGAILTYYDSANKVVRKLRSIVANNSANFITSPSVIGSAWEDVTPVVATGRKCFDVFYSLSSEAPFGALPLEGQVLNEADYPIFFARALELKAQNKIRVVTDSVYQNELAANGQVGAFVIREDLRRIRLPIINGFIQALSSGGQIGTIHSAGLPNITGTLPEVTHTPGPSATGAFRYTSKTAYNDDYDSENDHPVYSATFDANRGAAVSGIYGGANTVQPRSVELRLYIQVTEGNISGTSGGSITPADVISIVSSGGYITSNGASSITNSAISAGGFLASSGGWTAITSSGASIAAMTYSGGALNLTVSSSTRSAIYTVTDSGYTLLAGSSGLNGWYTSAEFQASDSAFIVNDVGDGNRAMLTLSGLHRAALVESNGQSGRIAEVVASSNGAALYFESGGLTATVMAFSGGVLVNVNDQGEGTNQALLITPSGAFVNNVPLVLVTSTSDDPSALIDVLSGGTSLVYTQPLTSLTVASVANTTAEDRLQFTLASGGSVTIPASCGVCPSGFTFEGGKSYLAAVMGGNVVAAEYAPGV